MVAPATKKTTRISNIRSVSD